MLCYLSGVLSSLRIDALYGRKARIRCMLAGFVFTRLVIDIYVCVLQDLLSFGECTYREYLRMQGQLVMQYAASTSATGSPYQSFTRCAFHIKNPNAFTL